MSILTTLAAAWLMASSGVSAAGPSARAMTSSDLGPAAFLWPPDRVWSADADNTAPCGSIAGVTNRTTFPLQSGKISLVAQDESFDLELAISYLEAPKSNSDFNKLIDMETFKDIKLGHTCVTLPDAESSVKAGTNATLQIKYIADFDKPENQTFYACADITYVALSDFKVPVPCFNATEPTPSGDNASKGGSSSSPNASAAPASGSGKSGLSGGAIAGIVIGSIAGVALIATAALLIFRRKQQRLRLLRQQNSERGKWAPGGDAARDSQSQGSVRMNNL